MNQAGKLCEFGTFHCEDHTTLGVTRYFEPVQMRDSLLGYNVLQVASNFSFPFDVQVSKEDEAVRNRIAEDAVTVARRQVAKLVSNLNWMPCFIPCCLSPAVKCRDQRHMPRTMPLSLFRPGQPSASPEPVTQEDPAGSRTPAGHGSSTPLPGTLMSELRPRCAESEGVFLPNPHSLTFARDPGGTARSQEELQTSFLGFLGQQGQDRTALVP